MHQLNVQVRLESLETTTCIPETFFIYFRQYVGNIEPFFKHVEQFLNCIS